MNAEQLARWQRIEAAPLISPEEDELFRRKLAVQNGWSREFTARCVAEYRRFVFLAVAAGHPMSPPDAIDQVWHLHLTYTREYWKVFCPEVLGQPLHHPRAKVELRRFRSSRIGMSGHWKATGRGSERNRRIYGLKCRRKRERSGGFIDAWIRPGIGWSANRSGSLHMPA